MGTISRRVLMSLSALGIAILTTWSLRAQYPVWYNLEAVPPTHVREGQCRPAASLNEEAFEVGCFDVRTGAWLDCETRFESRFDPPDLQDVAWTAGHCHDEIPRPIGNLFTVPSLGQSDQGMTWFAGQTRRVSWCATKTIPEVSGVFTVEAWYRSPPNYSCLEDFLFTRDPADHRSCTGYFGYDVGDDGFEELPPWPEVYVRCGISATCLCENVDPNHPTPFWGIPRMVAKVQDLASEYQHRFPGVRLRILDMSLPWGGLFDGAGDPPVYNWRPPHCRHRTGKSVDISKTAVTWKDSRLVGVDIDFLVTFASKLKLKRVPEATIHFELDEEGLP